MIACRSLGLRERVAAAERLPRECSRARSTSDGVSESRLRLDSDEWTERPRRKEGRRSQSHCRYWPTVSQSPGRKKESACAEMTREREMMFDGKGIKDRSIDRAIGHPRMPNRHDDNAAMPPKHWVCPICSLSSRVMSVSFVVVGSSPEKFKPRDVLE